mmetsp:Transcript_8761/g.13899  ORF Transcript_8761/g.13899 Transcript_8761/m.13899 type:complete len:168 (-) Transcript_8761:22-525(-)
MSPYSGQVQLINEVLSESRRDGWLDSSRVEISSVDSYQGREKEIVVISTARSNSIGTLGFLTDWRRLNVAITRAKRGVIVVGDELTVQADNHWSSMIQFYKDRDCVMTAEELLKAYGPRVQPERGGLGFWDQGLMSSEDPDPSTGGDLEPFSSVIVTNPQIPKPPNP